MAVKFAIRKSDGTIVKAVFPSEKAFVEGVQSKLGLPVDGNWGPGTTRALLAHPIARADASQVARINTAVAARSISAAAAVAAFTIAYAQELAANALIGTGLSIGDGATVEGFTPFTYSDVALGVSGPMTLEPAAAPPRPNPDTTNPNPDTTPPRQDGNFEPVDITPNTILGLPKPVAIGLGVGLGVFLLGGLALAASRNS